MFPCLGCKYLFESLLSILLGKYPESEFLDHAIILFLIFWGDHFAPHLTFPPTLHRASNYSTASPTPVIFYAFFSVSILMGVRGSLNLTFEYRK